MYNMLAALTEKTDKSIAVMKGVHDIMVKVLMLMQDRGFGSIAQAQPPLAPVTPVPARSSTDVIDLSDEWTAPIEKHKIDQLVKDLKNGRSSVYVSLFQHFSITAIPHMTW